MVTAADSEMDACNSLRRKAQQNLNSFKGSDDSLHTFMDHLFLETNVSRDDTLLVQDNAYILARNASKSAMAVRKKYLFGLHEHLVTKEICRWESYPVESEPPISVAKHRKAKNGCVPQRRAKQADHEAPHDVPAKALKSVPKVPQRRSSVTTDEVKNCNLQEELLALFEGDGSDHDPRTSLSPVQRIGLGPVRADNVQSTIPKMPKRRASIVAEDLDALDSLTQNNNNSNSNTYLKYPPNPSAKNIADFLLSGGSQHSQISSASTETTLSEIGSRFSDLSSLCSNEVLTKTATKTQLSPLLENVGLPSTALLDCAVTIPEKEELTSGSLRKDATNMKRNNTMMPSDRNPPPTTKESPELSPNQSANSRKPVRQLTK